MKKIIIFFVQNALVMLNLSLEVVSAIRIIKLSTINALYVKSNFVLLVVAYQIRSVLNVKRDLNLKVINVFANNKIISSTK